MNWINRGKTTEMKKGLAIFICGVLCFCGPVSCGMEEEENTTEIVTTQMTTEEATSEENESIVIEDTTKEPSLQSTEDEQLTALLQDLMKERTYSGDCSVGVVDLTSKAGAYIDSHSMQAASLIKLYIAGAIYENIENGLIPKTDNIDALLSIMISQSDNDAANSLVTILGEDDVVLGMQRVNEYCLKHGFEDTHMGRLLLASNDEDDNFTSVSDVTLFMEMIYEGKLAGSIDILAYMKEQERTAKLPAGIPEGIITANKTGELADVENDAMIVLSPQHPYVICVMCQYVEGTADAREWMTKVSGDVYNYYMEGLPDTVSNVENEEN